MITTVNIESLIVSTPDICNGCPRINQKRFSVAQIVSLTQEGLSPQQIVGEYSFLNLAEVYAALAYYYANQEQIEYFLAEEEIEYQQNNCGE